MELNDSHRIIYLANPQDQLRIRSTACSRHTFHEKMEKKQRLELDTEVASM